MLFSQPYTLFARHFPCSSGLQHTTRGTPDCAFTACMIPPPARSHCIHPALALRDTFPSVLSPLPAVSVPLPVSLPAADPCLLLQRVMPCKNHLHLFSLKLLLQAFTFHPTCSVAACCGCRFWLGEQKVSQGRVWVFWGSGAASAGAVSAESPVLLAAPLAAGSRLARGRVPAAV